MNGLLGVIIIFLFDIVDNVGKLLSNLVNLVAFIKVFS